MQPFSCRAPSLPHGFAPIQQCKLDLACMIQGSVGPCRRLWQQTDVTSASVGRACMGPPRGSNQQVGDQCPIVSKAACDNGNVQTSLDCFLQLIFHVFCPNRTEPNRTFTVPGNKQTNKQWLLRLWWAKENKRSDRFSVHTGSCGDAAAPG
jgi:hypothetical protein